jgi:hypothetical protein
MEFPSLLTANAYDGAVKIVKSENKTKKIRNFYLAGEGENLNKIFKMLRFCLNLA